MITETTERKLQSRASGKRIFALDAMRGLAAFIVIWHHFRLAFMPDTAPRWFLRPLFSGTQAVILFFVLSGYVLSLPYWSGRQLPYGRYLVRRIFRIYVPYVCATFLALIVAWHLLNSQLLLTPWFYETWHTPLTLNLIARQLLMITSKHFQAAINTAFWSLRYEMEMSIMFPALCWLLLQLKPWGTFVLGAVAMTVGGALAEPTLTFSSCFVFGALLAWRQAEVKQLYSSTPTWFKWLMLAAITFAYFTYKTYATTFGACGALIFAQHSRASSWLNTAIPEYLGRISYSMYLVHGTVLHATIILLYGRLPPIALGAIYFAATMAVSHLFCVLVEEPAMRMGKRLTQRAD